MPSSATRRRVASAPGRSAPVAPGGERDDVLVHGAGQRGRTAVMGELALQGGELGDGGAVAAELGGDAGLEQAGVAEGVVRLGHEAAFGVVAGGVLRRASAPTAAARSHEVGGRLGVRDTVVVVMPSSVGATRAPHPVQRS